MKASADLAVSVERAPDQDGDGLRAVQYDPCFQIADGTISKAGFDPGTRKRSDQVHTGYAFIGCKFDRKETVRGQDIAVGSLTISSVNLSLDQFRQREGTNASDVRINGRNAITYREPAAEACFVVMTGPDGVVDLMVDSTVALTDWSACDHAKEIASTVESALPK